MDSFISKMMGQRTPPPPSPIPPNPHPTARAPRSQPTQQGNGQPRVVHVVNHQRGTTTGARSQRYHALPPGLRVSKSGRTYHESRANRSWLPPR